MRYNAKEKCEKSLSNRMLSNSHFISGYLAAIGRVAYIGKRSSSNIRLAMQYDFAKGSNIKEQSSDGLNNF